ncbi:MAG: hypothetical protein AAF492_33670, partial [Verrucomicrobiota bacterium]
LTTPYDYQLPVDPGFAAAIEQKIEAWFTEHQLTPQPDGNYRFDLTVFSSLTEEQLPILRLRELTLPVDAVAASDAGDS